MNPVNRVPSIPALPRQGGTANVPGLRRLWLIEARHVLGVQDPRQAPGFINSSWLLTPTGLQLSEDAVLHLLKFSASRGTYEQKAGQGVHGAFYQQLINLTVPRDHPTTALVVQRMSGRKWIAICEDANGYRKVVGTDKQPLQFMASQKSNPNGYVFGWTTSTRQPAPFFNDPGALLVASDVEFATQFSYGFDYDFFS